MPQSVSVFELLSKLPDSSALIDCREEAQYAKYAPLPCTHVPYDQLVRFPERYLESGKIYYIICANGSISHRAAMLLELSGYNTLNVRGGYFAYQITPQGKRH